MLWWSKRNGFRGIWKFTRNPTNGRNFRVIGSMEPLISSLESSILSHKCHNEALQGSFVWVRTENPAKIQNKSRIWGVRRGEFKQNRFLRKNFQFHRTLLTSSKAYFFTHFTLISLHRLFHGWPNAMIFMAFESRRGTRQMGEKAGWLVAWKHWYEAYKA